MGKTRGGQIGADSGEATGGYWRLLEEHGENTRRAEWGAFWH